MTEPSTRMRPGRLQWQPCVHCGSLGLDARPDESAVILASPHCGHEEERRREAPADFLEQTCVCNGRLRERLPYVDTSTLQPVDTASQVATWVRSHL